MKRNDNAPPRAVFFRRELILSGSTRAVDLYLVARSAVASDPKSFDPFTIDLTNSFVVTADGTVTFSTDRGPKDALPIVFHHELPLKFVDWDAQMLLFVSKGYRVVAHDSRGYGHSVQMSEGYYKAHCASDGFAVAEALDLKNAAHVGHSIAVGEVARYLATHIAPVRRVANPTPVRVASAL